MNKVGKMRYNIEIQSLKSNTYTYIHNIGIIQLFYYLWKYDNNKAKRVKVTKKGF